jgi:hypothetical protein
MVMVHIDIETKDRRSIEAMLAAEEEQFQLLTSQF